MQEQTTNFDDIVKKYSHYLNKKPNNRNDLLKLGSRLFGPRSVSNIERPSLSLLKAKEGELAVQKEVQQVRIKSLSSKPVGHNRQEQQPVITQDALAEEIMVLQDKNGLLLARRKALEKQRNTMNDQYGNLMEKSIQQKVQLKLQMQRLKAELEDALSRSRPSFIAEKQTSTKPIMDELQDLNQQVLTRISSFKMAVSSDPAYFEKAVLDRYKPKMEKKLGQIYPYAEYLPVTQVHEKFNFASEKIEHKMRDIETELKNEHERNEQLQNEARQLADQVTKQTEEVNKVKRMNTQLSREIVLLKEISQKPLEEAKLLHEKLMNVDNDEVGLPSSARAIISTTGNEKRTIKRSPSAKWTDFRDSAIPHVKSVQEFVEEQKQIILDLLHS